MSFPARLHAAGQPSAGTPVTARFTGEYLIIEGGVRVQVACRELVVEAGGFNRESLFLHWGAGAARQSLQLADAAAQARLAGEAPASMAPALSRWRRGMKRQARGWRLIGAFAFAPIVVLALAIWQYDRLLGWLVQQVPVETEENLGAAAFEQLRSSTKLVESGPAAAAVQAVGARLTAGSRYRYHWAVKPDASINAFAMPGGYVVVHSGLIEAAASADELAGVLAHEVQHVERRHTLKAMIHSLGWFTAMSLLFGDISGAATTLIYQAGQLSYGRDLEREADRLGVQALVRAGIDPAGMANFFRTLAAQKTPASIALLSSHPATAERIAAVEADIAAVPRHEYPPLSIDWTAVQAAARAAADSR